MFRMLDVLPKIPQWKRVVLLATLFGCRAIVALPSSPAEPAAPARPAEVSLRCERMLHVSGDSYHRRDLCQFHDVEGRQCYLVFGTIEGAGVWCDTATAVTEI